MFSFLEGRRKTATIISDAEPLDTVTILANGRVAHDSVDRNEIKILRDKVKADSERRERALKAFYGK